MMFDPSYAGQRGLYYKLGIFGYMREFAYRAVPSAADRPNFGHGRPPKSEGRRTHP